MFVIQYFISPVYLDYLTKHILVVGCFNTAFGHFFATLKDINPVTTPLIISRSHARLNTFG